MNKRWIDLDVKDHPANMYWNHKKHFKKYAERVNNGVSHSDEEEEEERSDSEDEKKKKNKKKNKDKKRSEKQDPH